MGKQIWHEIYIIYHDGTREKVARVKSSSLAQIVYREFVKLYVRSHDVKTVEIK